MEIFAYEPSGYGGGLVRVEVDIRRGIPGVDLVGMAAVAVRESRERVRAAVRNAGFGFPQDRVLINLAPADLQKEGSSYDLPIALKILSAAGILPDSGKPVLALGELTLDGSVRPVRGVLPAVLAALVENVDTAIVPEGNVEEARAPGGGRIYSIRSLGEATSILAMVRAGAEQGQDTTGSPEVAGTTATDRQGGWAESSQDFSDIRGSAKLLRALEVAAAGCHNILLFGPPGSGKTMAAQRFPSILPDLPESEALSSAAIRSLAGRMGPGEVISRRPPFRAPHHSASIEGMVGGGRPVKPGEISLAHGGVLFLDETPEFRRGVLQALREPMEQGWIGVVRAGRTTRYPADFQLFLAANPCPCGNTGKPGKACVCSAAEIERYWKNLGGPLLDRIDMRIPVEPPRPADLLEVSETTSRRMRERVAGAVEAQAARAGCGSGHEASEPCPQRGVAGTHAGSRTRGCMNGRIPAGALPGLLMEDRARRAFEKLAGRLGLSGRACHSVLRVARTIADLENRDVIGEDALLEAVHYRRFGEGGVFWQ